MVTNLPLSELRNQTDLGNTGSLFWSYYPNSYHSNLGDTIDLESRAIIQTSQGWKPWARVGTEFSFRFFCVHGGGRYSIFKRILNIQCSFRLEKNFNLFCIKQWGNSLVKGNPMGMWEWKASSHFFTFSCIHKRDQWCFCLELNGLLPLIHQLCFQLWAWHQEMCLIPKWSITEACDS